MVRSAHAASLRVFPYTANEGAEMQRLIDCGVDGIITNYPKRLRLLLASPD
jgi:glycerophosphoryl diester phosphodiesterase